MGCSFKDTKGITITKAFQQIVDQSNRKLKKHEQIRLQEINKIMVARQLYTIDYTIRHGGKYVIAEKVYQNLKEKIQKYMTSIYIKMYVSINYLK